MKLISAIPAVLLLIGTAPAAQAALHDECVPRGEVHLGDRGGVGKRHVRWHGQRLAFVGRDELGVAGAGFDPHHRVADPPRRDARAESGDGAGELEPQDLRTTPTAGIGVAALTLQCVGAIDGAADDPHQDLIGLWDRIGHILHRDHVGPAVARDDRCPHG